MANSPPPPPAPSTEIEHRVDIDIQSIKTQGKTHLVSPTDLDRMVAETRIILLIEDVIGEAPIADRQTHDALLAEWRDIFAAVGGLSWDFYNQYARNCKQLKKAAEKHRAFIKSLQS